MRILVGLLVAVSAFAQLPTTKDDFNRMLDEMRAAIRRDDWAEASRLSIRINAALLLRNRSQGTPSLELQHLETFAGSDPISRNPFLPRMARAAFAAGDMARAERYAEEALQAAQRGVFWWTGDAVHQGNIVLGRLALRRGDVEEAKRRLLAAGKTAGSSSLGSLGPNMQLAKDLLDRGEKETVAAYLEECGSFWEGNRGKLAEWIVLVRAGLKPDFGANLGY
jgi:ATP/maltotriose-dependent transcriptional regulator MalT